MQFMVKDSKKYAATGGWVLAILPTATGSAALMKTCFSCHVPAKITTSSSPDTRNFEHRNKANQKYMQL
jgi:hypothetical protein